MLATMGLVITPLQVFSRPAIDSDPEREVRRNAVSALRSLPDGEGIPLLIQAARSHRDAEVRKHAMSVLGQSRDPRATAFFEDVLRAR